MPGELREVDTARLTLVLLVARVIRLAEVGAGRRARRRGDHTPCEWCHG